MYPNINACAHDRTATLIWSGVILIIVLLFLPETFPPILLKWKAKHLRDLTGDERYRGSIEVRQETFPVRLRRSLYRPFLLTFREPIVILVALYLTVIYIVLFTFLGMFIDLQEDNSATGHNNELCSTQHPSIMFDTC